MNINKSLSSKLQEFIDVTSMMDIHSHIDWSHPHARSPQDILFYHYVATELRSAGMPPDAISSSLPAEKAIRNALPYFPLIKNTSTHWCLIKMLRDLYGFTDNEIDGQNWRTLLNTIAEGTQQHDRYKWILVEKAKIKKTFLTLRHDEMMPQYDTKFFVGALRLDPLISLQQKESIQGLEKTTGTSIDSFENFSDSLDQLFKKFSQCVAVTASFQPDETFLKPTRSEATKPFRKLLDGKELAPEERRTVSSYSLRHILGLANEKRLVFQAMLGVRRPVLGAAPPDYAISGFETKTISSFCPLFGEFGELNFDVFTANPILSHELTVVAKNYPNVHLSGYWWYAFYPTFIRQFLRERLQMLPRNKSNGFFSDAYVVEWSYAKSCMVRQQITNALAEMVNDSYISEDLAKELVVDLLLKNPKSLYKLK